MPITAPKRFFALIKIGAGLLLLISAVLIGLDVSIRKLFGATIPGSGELAGFALGLASSWGIASCVHERSHIRIDTLYGLCGPKTRLVLDVVAYVTMAAILSIVAYYGFLMFTQSVQSQSRTVSELELSLAPIQALWTIGFAIGAVAAVGSVVADARALLGRNDPSVATEQLTPPNIVSIE
jgi:TRAP-type C4-dicarboxylate transport system permease small subunit